MDLPRARSPDMDLSGGPAPPVERTGRRLNCTVEVTGLTKSFGRVIAVEALDLCVVPGEIYGFLGLNGAGKTTTIRALLGLIRPSQGAVRVLGQRVGPGGRGPWRRVGHLVEAPTGYPELTIRENLEIARRLHAISDRGSVSRVIEALDLGRYADRKTGSLSTGSLQRLGLARALLHEPEVLILDEPANGLDPAGVVEIRRLLNRLAVDKGVTVFMSSHILTEVDRLATRIGIIHRGRLLEELDGHSLSSAGRLRVQVRPEKLALAVEAVGAAGLHAMVDAESASLALNDSQALSAPEQVATLLVHAGAPPTRLVVEQESLEDHFLRLTGGRL